MTEELGLEREIQVMPDDVREALIRRDLQAAYNARPAYQRNDYLAWLARAKRDTTRRKRLQQMLEELAHSGIYMNRPHRPSE
jgi:uncharacterized protein YdeI (YjbR/CyaY-like superfamily)